MTIRFAPLFLLGLLGSAYAAPQPDDPFCPDVVTVLPDRNGEPCITETGEPGELVGDNLDIDVFEPAGSGQVGGQIDPSDCVFVRTIHVRPECYAFPTLPDPW